MNVYVDESGDLGFSFDKPYRHGGSSRYLTIAFLIIPKILSHHPKRIVRELYEKKGKSTEYEIKGYDLSKKDKIFVAKQTAYLMQKYPEIQIVSMTVNKCKVKDNIRNDANKLYNYMTGLILPQKIKDHKRITLIPDKRSIKVESGNSLIDYLKIKLWFEFNSEAYIEYTPLESHTALNLLYIDWISHIIWKNYEDSETDVLDIFRAKIELSHLFF
jgi:hypothetical protein